jgi:Raf kinase inhibitor-like YbhB/YbcL family protein
MKGLLVCILFLSTVVVAQGQGPAMSPGQPARPPAGPGLTLTSTGFEDGGIIPNKYTMNAAPATAVSPALQWTNVPAGTVSFALILHDPDTSLRKSADEVLHWMIFNIPGTAQALPEGVASGTAKLPDGSIQALNTRQSPGYMGMGAGAAGPYHHYTFELFALDEKLDLGPDATRADVLKAMDGHVLGKGVVVGRFHR